MRSAPSAVVDLLNSRAAFVIAHLYTLTLLDGTVLRWSGNDRAISYGGTVWPLGPPIDRSNTKLVRGIEVDTLELDVYPRAADTVDGTLLAAVIVQGGLDGATLRYQRGYAASWNDPILGLITWFYGEIGSPEGGRASIKLPVRSLVNRLNVQMPRNLYAPTCQRQVYSADCGVVRADYTETITATAAGDWAFATNSTRPDGYFAQGVITCLTGAAANVGKRRTIKAYANASGQMTPMYAFPAAVAPGDTFSVYPGCDKTRGSNGCPKFSNELRFRGFPYVPVPETAL